jgi:hypothetical protein
MASEKATIATQYINLSRSVTKIADECFKRLVLIIVSIKFHRILQNLSPPTYNSGRTKALGSTQPLTEMSTRHISWGVKAAGANG